MENIFGTIQAPPGVADYALGQSGAVPGLIGFITVIIRLMIVGAGLFTLFNIILAGYAFLSAGEDSKKITDAWAKIWQSILGLAIAAGSLILAVIIGWLLFRNPTAIIKPMIYGPGTSGSVPWGVDAPPE